MGLVVPAAIRVRVRGEIPVASEIVRRGVRVRWR